MTTKEINAEIERLEQLREIQRKQPLPQGPKIAVTLSFKHLRDAEYRLEAVCTNYESIKAHQDHCLATYGHADGYMTDWQRPCGMTYRMCIGPNGDRFLHSGGGTVFLKDSFSSFRDTPITQSQYETILNGKVPRELLTDGWPNCEFTL